MNEGIILEECSSGKLLLLNKTPLSTPNINEIRPININSPLIKIMDQTLN